MMNAKRVLLAMLCMLAVGTAEGGGDAELAPQWAKMDSGLGELRHYLQWQEPFVYATPADSIDEGLGAMPHASQITEPWLYAQPAERLDSGLGSLPVASLMHDVWLHAQPAEKIDSGLGTLARTTDQTWANLAAR